LSCRVGEWRAADAPNVAQPHMRKDGQNVVINADAETIPAITSAAAGGIRCSLRDMLAWAQNWLVPDDRQKAWLTPEQRRPLWTPHTPMPISQLRRERDHSHFYAYGYGWRLSDVDNVWTVSHTGTLAGMYSVLTLLPDKRNGFVMLTNGNGGEARVVLNEVLLKHFTVPAEHHTVAEYADAMTRESSGPAREVPDTSAREPATLAQAQALLGVWRDPWFGEISICPRADSVRFNAAKSPLMAGQLMRVGERWLVAWDDDRIDAEAWVDVGADPKSKKNRSLTMTKVDPAADFSFDFEDLSFKRERDCE
jgi:hypothetical protein